MKKLTCSFLTGICFMLALAIGLSSCKSDKAKEAEFNPYVTAFTSGTISVNSVIKIHLNQEVTGFEFNTPIDQQLFKLSPSVDGEVMLLDGYTVQFRPKERLQHSKVYNVTFNLAKLIKDVESDYKSFEFSVSTITPRFGYHINGLDMYSSTQHGSYKLSGTITTADYVDNEKVEKILTAQKEKGKALTIEWEHGDANLHEFSIENIESVDQSYNIQLVFDGKSIDYDYKVEEAIKVPGINDFELLNVAVHNGDDQYIQCQFSAAIDTKQNLNGLITLSGSSRLTFKVELNNIFIYPSNSSTGTQTLTIHEGLRNTRNGKLIKSTSQDVTFESVKPAVRFVGKGSILPNSNGLIVPFQAVSIKSVTVRIIKIYESNVLQFLQVNQLGGKKELKRAGRLIKVENLILGAESSPALQQWATYSIDLSKLIEPEPGAIYRVELSFKQSQAIYPCSGESEQVDTSLPTLESEAASYDEPSNSYYYYYDDYDDDYDYGEDSYYSDPCRYYYYSYNKSKTTASRNILASNIGIIAKIGETNQAYIAASDLVTTLPMSGVEVELFSYQQQSLGKGTTDGDGMAQIQFKGKPYILVAKQGNQRAYQRLDDGSSNSLSSFDVSGDVVQKGLKGFIFGERGVWRPGDTLHLTFILEDKDKTLPDNHPVSFELINPMGQVVQKLSRTGNKHQFYSFTVSTDADAPTGSWSAQVAVGGASFRKTVKIETVKPNRLKIDLQLPKAPIPIARTFKGTITSKWLHGAPAKNLRAAISMILSPIKTTFKGFEAYSFDSPDRSFSSEERLIFDSSLDETGTANFSTSFNTQSYAPGMLKAAVVARVFEEGGDFSTNETNTTVSPYNVFVGVKEPKGTGDDNMLETDKAQTYEVVTVDTDGNQIDRSNLKVEIYKLSWSWWWSSSNGSSASYSQGGYKNLVREETISTKNGKGTFKFTADHSSWGRYLILVTDQSGHQGGLISYIDWPSWGGRPRQNDASGATMLSISIDKKKYNVGEKATIVIPSSAGSRALVSIESGKKVVKAFWVDGKANETSIGVDITTEMLPNVYAHVTLVQPHAQTKNDLPIRLYGVVPIMVEDPKTILKPEISMPDVIQPGETFKVKVSEANRQAMTYTIAVVDDGLLDLTNFKTPNPWNTFYAREALGVRTWDLYESVLGAYGGKIEQLFAIGGGDDAKEAGDKNKANRFKPVVMFLGPFTLSGGSETHTLTMPNYVGSVRTMVVAGNGSAYGSTEKTTPVRKPLMVLATLPRVLGPGEEVALPVNVFAMEPSIKRVSVEIVPNEMFTPVDEKTKTISFSSVGDEIVSFNLKVKEKIGIGRVKVIATSGGERAEYDIELDVRNANPKLYSATQAIVQAGKTWNGSYNLIGMEGTNAANLELSTFPPLNLSRRLGYLLSYPHGCIEQTTSIGFPQLYLNNVMDLSKDEKTRAEDNVKATLNRLKSFVTLEGGLAYWPGDRYPNLWGTSYAGHFMIEAENMGYSLPYGMKSSWIKFQKKEANNWSKQSKKGEYYTYGQADFDQAYRLYTLALAKSPETGAMNRLKERSDLSLQAKWMLAAAYSLAGQNDVAKQLVNNAGKEFSGYNGFSQSFGSQERDWAMVIETMTLIKEKEKAFELVMKVSEALQAENWMSTQTTAYCLMSLSKYAASDKNSKEINVEYSDNGKQTVSTRKPTWRGALKNLNGKLEVANKGASDVFVRIVSEGIPAAGNEVATENGVKLAVSYATDNSRNIEVSKLEQGTDFFAIVRVSNNGVQGDYKNMILSQVFPSGWEIINTRLNDNDITSESSYDYRDIRDDRVYTYFSLKSGETKMFIVRLNAAYKGKFYLPAASCSAMYDNSISANNDGRWVEVTN